MNDAITSTLEGIQKFLRYVAPGFVFIALLVVAYPSLFNQANDPLRASTALALAVGIIAGITLNSVHVAVLEDLLCLFVLLLYRTPLLRDRLPEETRALTARANFLKMEEQRMRRRISDEGPARRFQQDNDSFAATLTFLYCSSYPGFAIAIYQCIVGDPVDGRLLLSGVIFLLVGVICDVRYVQIESWAIREFRLDQMPAVSPPRPPAA